MNLSAFEVCQLAFADVVTFQRVLTDSQRTRQFRMNAYRTARSAIRHYHLTGDFVALSATIAELRQEQGEASGMAKTLAKNNAEVLERYAESFATPYRPLIRHVPGRFSCFQADLCGLEISAKPHFTVESPRGKEKFVYLLLAKEWDSAKKGLFVSLLGEIVSRNMGIDPRDVEGWDCREGKKIVRAGLGRRAEARVAALAAHLTRQAA